MCDVHGNEMEDDVIERCFHGVRIYITNISRFCPGPNARPHPTVISLSTLDGTATGL